jgi:hypothetical protein
MSNNNSQAQSPPYNPMIAQYNPANTDFANARDRTPFNIQLNMPSSPPNNAGYVMNESDGESGTPPSQLPSNGLTLDQLQEGRTYRFVGSFRMYNATTGVSGNRHLPLHQDLEDFRTVGLTMRDRSPIFGATGETEYTVTFENYGESFAVGQEDLAPGSYFLDVNRNPPLFQTLPTPLTINSPSSSNSPIILRANNTQPIAPAYEYPPESPDPNYTSNNNKPKTKKVNKNIRRKMYGGKRKTRKGKPSRKSKSRRLRKY